MSLIRRATGRLLAALATVLLLLVLAAELYTRTPDGFSYARLGPGLTADVTLIFHGSRDADNPVFTAIRDALLDPGGATRTVRYIDWSEGADNRPRAAANAMVVGRELGARLAAESELRSLHLIAHSSGAFVPDALCRAYREGGGQARVRMTFLDPFQLRGLVGIRYGARHHGECADFALAIMNTEDPAPSTNAFLQQAYNLDVTADARRQALDRNGHYWPPAYLLASLADIESRFGTADHAEYPRGSVRSD